MPVVGGACHRVGMAGGMHGKNGPGTPIGARSGMQIDEAVARPWEEQPWPTVAPQDAHVELLLRDDEWVQALLVEQRREGDRWVCRVVWAGRGVETRVRNEWVPAERVRTRA